MKNKISGLVYILAVIIVLYLLRTVFSEYNLKRTMSACILAKKGTSELFDLKKAEKFCEEEIRKEKKD